VGYASQVSQVTRNVFSAKSQQALVGLELPMHCLGPCLPSPNQSGSIAHHTASAACLKPPHASPPRLPNPQVEDTAATERKQAAEDAKAKEKGEEPKKVSGSSPFRPKRGSSCSATT
jgi:hypothetical protein